MHDTSMLSKVAETIGALLVAGGGGAAIAWGIFSKFGDRWLEQRFATRLEQFRHEKAQEIERLRHQIAAAFSRISKIHDKEFEVLPAAFLKLHQAYGSCTGLTSAWQQYPDLDRMNDILFAEFMQMSRLPTFRNDELRLLRPGDRNEYYRRWIFWVEFAEAKRAQGEFHNYLVMNRIFMTQSLRDQFGEIDRLMNSALISLEIDWQGPGTVLLDKARKDIADIGPLMAPFETAIQERLHYQEA